jgi:hypothetical protein
MTMPDENRPAFHLMPYRFGQPYRFEEAALDEYYF